MRQRSLTRQLVLSVLLAEFLCALVFSTVAILHERSTRLHAFDLALHGRADSLLGAVQDSEDPQDDVMVDATELTVPAEDRFEVLSLSGRVLGHSADASPLLLQLGRTHADGYFNFRAGGVSFRALRIPGLRVIDRDQDGGQRVPVLLLYAAPTDRLWHQVLEAVRFYVVLGSILLSVTGLLLVWLLRRGLAPLRDLARKAAEVSTENWAFHPPAKALETAELAPMALAMRDLLRNLEQAFERERQFTGDAAHELKTSVAILKSGLQLLTMRPRTPGEYIDGLDSLLFDLERMEELINRMLTLARILETPAGNAPPLDAPGALQQLVRRFSALAETREITLQLQTPHAAFIAVEPEDLEILCSNLLMNALQHSSRAGEVCITLEAAPESFSLTVLDHGTGIPVEALPHVFDRFFRADRSRSRKSGGAGLGLATCKAIVDRYHGLIRIGAVPGGGTAVHVTLPLATFSQPSLPVFSQA